MHGLRGRIAFLLRIFEGLLSNRKVRLERDPEAVRQDVYDRRITVLMAHQQYGVVRKEPGLSVDQEATHRLRTMLWA